MAAEEDARIEWVRYHLAHGDKEGAAPGWDGSRPRLKPPLPRHGASCHAHELRRGVRVDDPTERKLAAL